jgi:hypothetical protein
MRSLDVAEVHEMYNPLEDSSLTVDPRIMEENYHFAGVKPFLHKVSINVVRMTAQV